MSMTESVPRAMQSLPTRGIKGSPLIWMNEKRARDAQIWQCDSSDYWIVESKLYNLAEFANNHPGGSSWITMTKGQDITELFITHHLNQDKARSLLQKYYVKDCKKKVTRFTFEQTGIYREIKKRVLGRMTIQQIQNEDASKRYAQLLFALFMVSLLLSAYLKSYIFAAICSILLVGIVGVAHNFVHHKQNIYRYLFSLTGFTHTEWQIMHCMSHHPYPNTELDYEASAFEPIYFALRSLPANKIYTQIIVTLAFIMMQPLNLILKFFLLPLLKQIKPDFLYLVSLLVFFTHYYFDRDLWTAAKLHFFTYGLQGLLFSRILFCGHRLPHLWTEGASQRFQDFGQHTLRSTNDSDIELSGILSYLFTMGFNLHTSHHFFPTADHNALHKIYDIMVQYCKQKGIKMSKTTRKECMTSVSKGIVKRAPYTIPTL